MQEQPSNAALTHLHPSIFGATTTDGKSLGPNIETLLSLMSQDDIDYDEVMMKHARQQLTMWNLQEVKRIAAIAHEKMQQ